MLESAKIKLLLLTPIFILLAHYLAVFPHEYAHSIMAWSLGFKEHPLAIDYGGTSWINLLLLFHIDENVDYNTIFVSGHAHAAALIAFAGPGIANGLLYFISLGLLATKKIQSCVYSYYFFFWFNFMNMANFFDYVPVRVFSSHGDMAHLAQGLNISSWYLYIVLGYLTALAIWYFFTRTLIRTYIQLDLHSIFAKASLMILSVLILFGYFGMAGFIDYGDISHFLSGTSFIVIPGVIAALWPTRDWVKRQLVNLKNDSTNQ